MGNLCIPIELYINYKQLSNNEHLFYQYGFTINNEPLEFEIKITYSAVLRTVKTMLNVCVTCIANFIWDSILIVYPHSFLKCKGGALHQHHY